jgi:hypothetical protein
LIIGFLLGVALDAQYRPNNILLYINPDGKESLSPQPGDIISFASDKDLSVSKVNVTYTADLIPCEKYSPFPPSTCIYKPFAQGPDLYFFGCTYGPDNKHCYDPQYGPQCVGCGAGPGTGGQFPHPQPELPLLRVVFWDLEAIFRIPPSQQARPQGSGSSSGGSQSAQVFQAQAHDVNSSSPPPRVQEYVAGCYNGAPGIFNPGDPEPIDRVMTPINAEPGDTITLALYPPPNSYSTSGLSGVCSSGDLSAGSPSCIVNNVTGTYKFQLKMACATSGSTDESISVTKPSALANAASR